jgi:hypothetical protein
MFQNDTKSQITFRLRRRDNSRLIASVSIDCGDKTVEQCRREAFQQLVEGQRHSKKRVAFTQDCGD